MTTFAEVRLQVQTNCGGRDNEEFQLSIKYNLNALLTWLATQCEWPELQRTAEPNLIVGQASYTKLELEITDIARLYNIKLFDGVDWRPPMQYLTKQRFDAEIKPCSASLADKPSVFTTFGSKYIFNVNPDVAYLLNIDYYAHPTPVTSDTSIIPYDKLDGPIAAILSGYGWLSLGDSSMANVWFKTGTDQLNAIGIDTRSLLNFKPPARGEVVHSSQPWIDPFQRRS